MKDEEPYETKIYDTECSLCGGVLKWEEDGLYCDKRCKIEHKEE